MNMYDGYVPFCFEGYVMDDIEYAAKLDRQVRADYPAHADEARAFINKILRQSDWRRWRVFNRKALGEIHVLDMTHHYISLLLERRDRGDPVTDLYLESAVRACLGLGFAVIEGGRKE